MSELSLVIAVVIDQRVYLRADDASNSTPSTSSQYLGHFLGLQHTKPSGMNGFSLGDEMPMYGD